MPARDRDHDVVHAALIADGWTGVARLLLARQIRKLISYDPVKKVIVRWIP